MTTLDQIDAAMDGIEDRVNENYEAVGPAAAFAKHASLTEALHLALYGGISPLSGNDVAGPEFDLDADDTSYVQLNSDDTFTVTPTTPPAGWPNGMSGAMALGVATAGPASFTWVDLRFFGTAASVLAAFGFSSVVEVGDFVRLTRASDGKVLDLGPFA